MSRALDPIQKSTCFVFTIVIYDRKGMLQFAANLMIIIYDPSLG